MLNLFCYVRGNDSFSTFKVDINEDKTVDDLRDAIKEKKKPSFDNIPAGSLRLWKASSLHYNQNLKSDVEALNLVDGDMLQPVDILSDIFSFTLERKSVHIIIDRPGESEQHISDPLTHR